MNALLIAASPSARSRSAALLDGAAGAGPWPLARQLVDRQIQEVHRQRRIERAHPLELSFAI